MLQSGLGDAVTVAVAVAVGLEVDVLVAVDVDVAVLVAVAVGLALDVGLAVDVDNVNDRLQVLASCAFGLLDGTFGATAVFLVWYNLIAVNIATPASNIVVIIIPMVVNLFFIILLFPF